MITNNSNMILSEKKERNKIMMRIINKYENETKQREKDI